MLFLLINGAVFNAFPLVFNAFNKGCLFQCLFADFPDKLRIKRTRHKINRGKAKQRRTPFLLGEKKENARKNGERTDRGQDAAASGAEGRRPLSPFLRGRGVLGYGCLLYFCASLVLYMFSPYLINFSRSSCVKMSNR